MAQSGNQIDVAGADSSTEPDFQQDDEDLRAIPVIAITAFAMKGDEEKIRQGGCEAYLSKPISVVKFLETVRNYLGDA